MLTRGYHFIELSNGWAHILNLLGFIELACLAEGNLPEGYYWGDGTQDNFPGAPSKDEEEELWEDEEVITMGDMPTKTGSTNINGNIMMLLVDRSGIHHLLVKWCSCPNAAPSDVRLLSNRRGQRSPAEIQLQMYAKQINKKGTTAERLELEERCQHLLSHVDAFNLKVERYQGNNDVTEFLEEVPGWPNSNKDNDAEDINLFDLLGSFNGDNEPIERRKLVLPSNLGKGTCKIKGLHHLVSQELTFQESQANNALHQIHIHFSQPLSMAS
ncbi:hypothetical protein SERLA73DRAFT_79275 [Serpula lacrymans var. lacrymans S7.3]|uniref:CxC2-like cysteine cluster KDZ transposase-associated domain-containing protein n=2 Tax=Serpula lacrymans var. lacrymans TaxID=341189 RepID=F8QFW6_SERL3|nr:uncharacterized protein SERLADRAFT_444071 [Serpula lacrymans var. lacrymans S7.9]EGN92811.1 hypothetical protein SERLA73DRAFT_79275 [Serpula lacrymans var. lacrymans S7.3]EGO18483.1 hypothetical protein SERLADRAFT_444071 [Serpula lacrymans var. lacrymans S7.9]